MPSAGFCGAADFSVFQLWVRERSSADAGPSSVEQRTARPRKRRFDEATGEAGRLISSDPPSRGLNSLVVLPLCIRRCVLRCLPHLCAGASSLSLDPALPFLFMWWAAPSWVALGLQKEGDIVAPGHVVDSSVQKQLA